MRGRFASVRGVLCVFNLFGVVGAGIAMVLVLSAATLGGCSSYSVPGGPADFRALGITQDQQASLTDKEIAERLARKPAANFPAVIATVRVQDNDYRSHSYHGSRGEGKFSVVTLRELESDVDMERLGKLPMVRGLAPMNRLVVPERVNDEKSLRLAAADLQADVVLVYTIDTRFGSKTLIPILGTITLGMFPAEEAQVTTTASAALVDTRTGYVYGLAEATEKASQLANLWTTSDAIDDSRLRAEKAAFSKMVGEIEKTWVRVAASYGPTGGPQGGTQTPGAAKADVKTEGGK
ncbi:MAG: hypothetical protein U0638_11515 [Phycisphaerales bacterium]